MKGFSNFLHGKKRPVSLYQLSIILGSHVWNSKSRHENWAIASHTHISRISPTPSILKWVNLSILIHPIRISALNYVTMWLWSCYITPIKTETAQMPVMIECTMEVATFLHFHFCWCVLFAEGGTTWPERVLTRAKVAAPPTITRG